MVIKVFVDLHSQPCRALVIFLKHTKIPFEIETLSLRTGEHKKPEFTKVTPLNTLPAIQDGDFGLAETVAIIRYLATKYPDKVPDHWYPKDLQKRTRVDEYMAYHHSGTRQPCCEVFVNEVIVPMFKRKPPTEEKVKKDLESLKDKLDKLERAFLRNNKYLTGDEISVADILAVCEMMQNTISGRDVTEGRPELKAYVARVKERLNPVLDEVSASLYEWTENFQKQ